MSVYPYRKREGAWYRSTPFIIAITVVIVALYIFIWNTNPVDSDHANTFLIVLRYTEFIAKTLVEVLFDVLLLVGTVVYFLQLIGEKQIYDHSPVSSYPRRKSRHISLSADRFRHSGIKGIVVGTFVSLILLVLGGLTLYWIVIPEIEDIPDTLTGHPATLNAQVTDAHWIHGKRATWNFDVAGKSFSTPFVTLREGEYATVTYLPHSHFIIEYKCDRAE